MALTRGEQGHQYLATFLAVGGITAAVMLIAHPLQRGPASSPGGAASAPVEATPGGQPAQEAAAGPDALATTGKRAFVGQWNPVATRYGLPTYRWNQL